MNDDILGLSEVERRLKQRRTIAQNTKESLFKKAKMEADDMTHEMMREHELEMQQLKQQMLQEVATQAQIIFEDEEYKRSQLTKDFKERQETVKSLLIEEVFNLGNR